MADRSWRSNKTNPFLRISLQGRNNRLQVGKDVLRVLGAPRFITFRVNKQMDSILIECVEERHNLSFKVPAAVMEGSEKQMYITSESFVMGLMVRNGLDVTKTYEIPGLYSEKHNAVVFKFSECEMYIDDNSQECGEDVSG